MARYTGPDCKLCRRSGQKLFLKGERCLSPKCAIERRNGPPGQQTTMRRRKQSERAVQLREKQKARWSYGVLEKQFQRHFADAERRKGITGENLMQILEMRLDNVVYRMGFADSRDQARQLVNHGHFALNGRRTNIASARVKPNDSVSVYENSRKLDYFKGLDEVIKRKQIPAWLSVDPASLSGRVITLPSRNEIDTRIDEQIIVEYYSR